jgi:FtsP/CotA-like multicopper oxidase with cupredoxin domain
MDGVHDLTQHPTGGARRGEFRVPVHGTGSGDVLVPSAHGSRTRPGPVRAVDHRGSERTRASRMSTFTLMLDDWLDGYGRTAEDVLRRVAGSPEVTPGTVATTWAVRATPTAPRVWVNMGGSGGMGSMMNGGLAGDVVVSVAPHQRPGAPSERETIEAKAGQRVRLRLINAGSDTAYRVAVDGHRLTVTHADGFPVVPVEVDNVRVRAWGSATTSSITAGDGAFADRRGARGQAPTRPARRCCAPAPVVTAAATGTRPAALSRPQSLELHRSRGHLSAAVSRRSSPDRRPSRCTAHRERMSGYVHGIGGQAASPTATPITVAEGERAADASGERHDDVPPDPSARPHVPDGLGAGQCPQGHRQRRCR